MLKPYDVKIQLFEINRCGYYRRGQPQPAFSSIEDVLTQLQQWTGALKLSQTKIHDPNPRDNIDPVYMFGIKKAGGSWIIATWNEIPHTESGVPSVPMDANVGDTDVHMNDIEEDSIPGYATYFWINPRLSLLATIRFDGLRTGQPGLVAYLARFMSRYTRYAIIEDRPPEGKVAIGYTDKADGVPTDAQPVFKTRVVQKKDHIKDLLDNADKVKRVFRRGHLTTTSVVDKAFWQSAIQWARGQPKPDHVVRQRVSMELDYRPTRVELEAMINGEQNDLDAAGWDDMGFLLDGEKRPTWLSSARASGELTLNLRKHNDVAVDLDTLLDALQANQHNILQFMK